MKSCQNPIIVTQTCTKAINLHNEITTKYLIAIQSTIQQFQTGELIIDESWNTNVKIVEDWKIF